MLCYKMYFIQVMSRQKPISKGDKTTKAATRRSNKRKEMPLASFVLFPGPNNRKSVYLYFKKC